LSSAKKRLRAKLLAMKTELRRRMHDPIAKAIARIKPMTARASRHDRDCVVAAPVF
jgi:hypothetical protein